MKSFDDKASEHNSAIPELFGLLMTSSRAQGDTAGEQEAAAWVMLESLCLGVILFYGREPRKGAYFIEAMAERIATGERTTRSGK
jgi:hypothetical protein